MRLRITSEPQQGADYATQLRAVQAAEALDYEAFFRSDHYLREGPGDGFPGPTDTWITLAGMARETDRIRLGSLLTSATFRLPGLLAVCAAQVDRMSGGRIEFGLGAGWYAEEHHAYGIPFPSDPGERFDRYQEQLEIITGMWSTPEGETFTFEGEHYELWKSPALPKPVQRPRPPLIVGGTGRRRLPELAATFADEYNVPFASLEETQRAFARVRAAADRLGRSEPLVLSAAQTVCCGRSDVEVGQRARRAGLDPEALGRTGLCGSPEEIVDRISRYAEIGTEVVYLQFLDLEDLDHMELVAREVGMKL